jgi:hypothetical protein
VSGQEVAAGFAIALPAAAFAALGWALAAFPVAPGLSAIFAGGTGALAGLGAFWLGATTR